MTSTRDSSAKRAARPHETDYSRTFKKDWDRLTRSGRCDMNRLKEAMQRIAANDGPLPPEWSDHELRGAQWKDHRERHIGGDFLLIYRIFDGSPSGKVSFVRAGTHSELFG